MVLGPSQDTTGRFPFLHPSLCNTSLARRNTSFQPTRLP